MFLFVSMVYPVGIICLHTLLGNFFLALKFSPLGKCGNFKYLTHLSKQLRRDKVPQDLRLEDSVPGKYYLCALFVCRAICVRAICVPAYAFVCLQCFHELHFT